MKLPFISAIALLVTLDLQHFAEGAEDAAGGEEEQTQDQQQEQQQEKTFTQKDVNNIVSKESKKALENFLKENGIEDFKTAKEGMAKFKEWQESQKTEAQKQAEALEQASKDLEATKAEKDNLVAQLEAFKLGVKAESLADFILLARAKVTDEVSLEDAMKQTLEAYPTFKGEAEQEQQKPPLFTTGQHQKTAPKEMTREEFAKKSYAERVEYQTKYPELFKKLFQ